MIIKQPQRKSHLIPSPTNRFSDKGFSLIELMVVLAIVAIIGLVGTPKLLDMRSKSSVRADSRELFSAIRKAQSMAVKRSEEVCVKAVEGGTTFETYLKDGVKVVSKKDLRSSNYIAKYSFLATHPPCFNSRGLPVDGNSGNIIIASQSTPLEMDVRLTVAGHVKLLNL